MVILRAYTGAVTPRASATKNAYKRDIPSILQKQITRT
jgi:hypothetical protein